jgi:hypothetical protein
MRRDVRAASLRRLAQAAPGLELLVNELVLYGFPAEQRYAIGEAFQQELEHQFAGADLHGSFQEDAALPALDGGSIALPAQARPAAVGIQAARAVQGAILK